MAEERGTKVYKGLKEELEGHEADVRGEEPEQEDVPRQPSDEKKAEEKTDEKPLTDEDGPVITPYDPEAEESEPVPEAEESEPVPEAEEEETDADKDEEETGGEEEDEKAPEKGRESRGRRFGRGFGRRRRRRKHRKRHFLLTALIVILVIGGIIGLMHLPYFHVTQISVVGNKAFTDDQIIEQSGVQMEKSIFRAVPVLVEKRVGRNYYFDDVNVNLHLPGMVEIIVHEQEGFAQILVPENEKNKRKQYVIIDEEGKVIEVSYDRRDVTLIRNLTVQNAREGRRISVKEKSQFRKGMNIIRTAQENDMYFKRVEMNGNHVKCDIFDDMFVKGKYGNLIKSLERGELRAVVYRLYQQNVMSGTINIADNGYCSFTPEN